MNRPTLFTSKRRPSICATSIAAFLAAAAVSPGDTYQVDLGDTLTVSSVVPDFITKNGDGTLILTNTNTLTGAVNVNGGALVISSIGNLTGATSISINHNPAAGTSGNTGITQGVSAGQLVIGGTYAPQTFDFTAFPGGLALAGGGPGGNGSALNVIGNTTVLGIAASSTTTTRIASNFGTLTSSGLAMSSVGGGTTAQTLQLIGNGHFSLTGLTGAGTLVKSNAGTLILTGSNSNTGSVQMDSGFVRVQTGANLGTSTAANSINFNNGNLEVRTDDGSGFTTKGVSIATNSGTMFLDRAVAGTNATAINQTVNFGNLQITANRTLTVNGRNGYGVNFTGNQAAGAAVNNNLTFANNANGLLTFTGNVWTMTDGTARTLVLTANSAPIAALDGVANGGITITGNILASGDTHAVAKTGTGIVTVLGTGSTFLGTMDVRDGTLVARNFGSIGNATSAGNINLGNQTTTGTLTFIGTAGAGAVGASARNIVLNGISGGGGRINANQSGTAATAVVMTGTVTAGAGNNTRTLTLGGSSTLQNDLSGVISNSGASLGVLINKTNAGTWVLSGANTYTGATTISNGTLRLRVGTAGSNILPDANAITFAQDANNLQAGGTLDYFNNNSGSARTETLGVLTPTDGANTVRTSVAGTNAANLIFSSLAAGSSTAGASINFVPGSAASTITITGASGYQRASTYFNGADFAFVGTAATSLRAPIYGTDANFISVPAAGALGTSTATHNVVLGSITNVATSIASLKIIGTATPTITLSGRLNINPGTAAGGILLAGGNATITGSGIGRSAGTTALVVRTEGANTLTIASSLGNTVNLVKNGAGTLLLTSSLNANIGTTILNEGTLRLGGLGVLGATSNGLTMRQGTTLDLNGFDSGNLKIGTLTGAGTITTSSVAAVLSLGSGNSGGTFNGIMQDGTGTGALSVLKRGTGTLTLNGLSTYTGSMTVGGNGLVNTPFLANIGTASGIGRGNSTDDTTNAASLVFGSIGEPYGTASGGITYTGTASVSIDRLFTLGSQVSTAVNGARIVAAGSNNATLIFNKTNDIAYTAGAQTVAHTLTLGGASTGDNQINLRLTNPSGGGSAVLGVTKADAGTWVLGNTGNDYTGSTQINGGRLIAPEGTLSASSPVSFSGNGVLEATGTISRTVTATPSAGTGTLTWNGSGGLSASHHPLTVSLNGGAGLLWNDSGFVTNTGAGGTGAATLFLNSITSLDELVWQNPIDFNAGSGPSTTLARTIQVEDNATTSFDRATITGVLSGTLGTGGFVKAGGGSLFLTGVNTYTGTTNLNAGVLGVISMADGLGDVGNGLTLGGGRFDYLGVGETSARAITVNATTTINASGSGALVLSNVLNNGSNSAAKTLNLEGQNADANEISNVLANSTGALSVTKGGPGTWILSGANTFTGTLSATSGNLGLTAAASTSAGTLTIGNGNLFADGGDITITAPTVNLSQNATGGIIGLNSITLSGATVNVGSGNNSNINNFLPTLKTFAVTGTITNTDTANNRAVVFGGTGRTELTGVLQDQTGTQARTLGVTVNSGTVVLGGASANTYTGATTINGGTLQLAGASGDVIPRGVALGATALPAVFDLNGTSESITTLTASSTGANSIDNGSASAATLTLATGTVASAVNFNGNVTSSMGGSISLIKTGTGAATFSGATFAGLTGTVAVNAGTLLFNGVGSGPTGLTGIQVDAGATFSLNNNSATPISGLTLLNLGSGSGIATLALNLGSGFSADSLITSNPAITNNTIGFDVFDLAGFGAGTYNLLTAPSGLDGAIYNITNSISGYILTLSTSATSVDLIAVANTIANTLYWTNDADNSWATSGNTNWADSLGAEAGVTPGPLDTVIFSSQISTAALPVATILTTLDSNIAVNNLIFNGQTSASGVEAIVRIAAGTPAGTLTIAPSSAADGITMLANSGVASITAPVALGTDQTWDISGTGTGVPTLVITGNLSGAANVTKIGGGIATLSGSNNNYTGKISINGGTVGINTELALGTVAAVTPDQLSFDGGTLRFNAATLIDDANRGITLNAAGGSFDTAGGNGTIAAAVPIVGSGSLTKTGANTLILVGPNTYTGGSTVSGGALRVLNNGSIGTGAVNLNALQSAGILELGEGVNLSNSLVAQAIGTGTKTVRLLAGVTTGTYSGSIDIADTIAGNVRVDSNVGTLTVSGVISSSGSPSAGLRKEGAGTVIIGNTNTYSGGTFLNAGTTILNNTSAIGSGDLIAVGNSTVSSAVDLAAGVTGGLVLGANLTVSSASNNLQFNGTSTLLNGNANRTLTNNGTGATGVVLAGPINLGAAANTASQTLTIAGTGITSLTGGIANGSGGTTANGLTITNTNLTTLSGLSTTAANNYLGLTTISAGTVAINTSSPSLTGGLTLGAAATVLPVALDLNAVSATFGGPLIMNINSTAASTITVDAGQTLTVNNNVQIGATTPAVGSTVTNLALNGGGAFNVITAAAGTFIVGGSTSGTNASDTTLDLTALATTTINASTTGTIRVNNASGTNIVGSKATLLLPTPGVGDATPTATLTAGTIAVGNSSMFNAQDGQINTLRLGTGLTTLNADTINVGNGSRDLGQIIFAGADGDLILRAADGSSPATALNIGTGGATTGTPGTAANTTNLVDFSNHDADILVTTLNVGNQARAGNLISEFKFGTDDASIASVLDATNVNIGLRTGGTSVTSTLTNRVNISGGTVTFGNIGGSGAGVDIGNSTYSGAGAASTIGELNISAGTVAINNSSSLTAAVRLGSNVVAGGGTVNASMNLTGGTTTLGGDIIRGATAPRTTSIVLLDGVSASLDMGGNDIGTAIAPITFDVRQGTLSNLGELNGGGPLTKTTGGTLTLSGTSNTYTGSTVVNLGLVQSGANDVLPDGSALVIDATTATGTAAINVGTFNDTVGTITFGGSTVANAVNVIAGSSGIITLTGNVTSLAGSTTAVAAFTGNVELGTADRTFTVADATSVTDDLTVSASITSSSAFGIIKAGAGTLLLSGTNTYAGDTTINAGTLAVSGGAAIAGKVAVGDVAGATFQLNNSETIAGLNGGGTVGGSVNLQANTLTVFGAGSNTFNGNIAGTSGTGAVALVVDNGAALTLDPSVSNTFTGQVTVGGTGTGSVLLAQGADALAAVDQITVNAGGTLFLSNGSGGAGNRINDGAGLVLDGGIFNTGGLSETLGTLTLSSTSTIDFGAGASILTFADSDMIAWTGTLNLWNWTGIPGFGGGADQLRFTGDGLTGTQLSQIAFYSDNGVTLIPGYAGNQFVGAFGEVVPVPEPSSALIGLAMFGIAGWRERRKSDVRRRAERTANRS